MSLKDIASKVLGSIPSPPDPIEPGMRFKQSLEGGAVWVVVRPVKSSAFSIPHFMIREESEEREGEDVRIISDTALRDKKTFRYLPGQIPRGGNPKQPRHTPIAGERKRNAASFRKGGEPFSLDNI